MSLSRRVHSNGPAGADGCGVRPLARFMLAVLSAALLIASLPAPDIGWLGWVALIPLLISIDGLRPLRAAGLGLVTGILASFGIYGWLFEVPSFDMRHAVLVALYVGAYHAAWSATTAWLTGRHVPLIVAAPALWLVCDYLRAHAGFLALPWGTLAQTQHLNIALLQVAGFVGEHGVTFLVAMGNAGLAALLLRRERQFAAAAALLLALVHAWGAAEAYSPVTRPIIIVAALQPNIQIGERKTEAGRSANLVRLEQLTREASASRPALIVWPESAIPGDLFDPTLVGRVQTLSEQTGVPTLNLDGGHHTWSHAALLSPVLASEQASDMVSNQTPCEGGTLMLVAEGSGDAEKGTEQSGDVQERAVPRPNLRMMKPIFIDPVTGTVMAQSLVTGKTVRMNLSPATIARHRMTVGVPFDVGEMSPGANGNCECGQYSDGSCYCVSDIKECCGPLHGCPMASCDKKQPIPGAGDKPIFQTS